MNSHPSLSNDETIVAIATAPGRGGIGVVRLSGSDATRIVAPLIRLQHELAPGRARFGELLDPETGSVLDEVVVTYFAAPHSYTRQDVVELATHGAPVLLEHIVRYACVQGARLAEPGEFTQRAFLAGRIDLTQAEAVRDLIEASTLHQAQTAARQLGGSLSRSIAPIKEQLVNLIAALEAGIDFAEDDIDLLPTEQIAAQLAALQGPLQDLAESYRYGRIVRDGFRLAIVGRPNAGKSSLFNRLLSRERAIVTALPGTTRDPIVDTFSVGGVPVELVDTAGLREVPPGPEGEAERQGIARSGAAMAEADIVLLAVDAQIGLRQEDRRTLERLQGRPHLIVWNKVDLVSGTTPSIAGSPSIQTSTVTGEGIDELRQMILAHISSGASQSSSAMLTNLRQHQAVSAALEATNAAQASVANSTPHEMLLLDLYGALEALDRLTGATGNDDILKLIFSTFCIGK